MWPNVEIGFDLRGIIFVVNCTSDSKWEKRQLKLLAKEQTKGILYKMSNEFSLEHYFEILIRFKGGLDSLIYEKEKNLSIMTLFQYLQQLDIWRRF